MVRNSRLATAFTIALQAFEVEGGDVVFDHLFEIDRGFELSGDFFHQRACLVFDLRAGDHFELSEYAVVHKATE